MGIRRVVRLSKGVHTVAKGYDISSSPPSSKVSPLMPTVESSPISDKSKAERTTITLSSPLVAEKKTPADMNPISRPKKTPEAASGILTSGEVNDFRKWGYVE